MWPEPEHKVRLYFKWFDFWVGAFYDTKRRWLYIQPLPMVGVIFDFYDYPAYERFLEERRKEEYFEANYS